METTTTKKVKFNAVVTTSIASVGLATASLVHFLLNSDKVPERQKMPLAVLGAVAGIGLYEISYKAATAKDGKFGQKFGTSGLTVGETVVTGINLALLVGSMVYAKRKKLA